VPDLEAIRLLIQQRLQDGRLPHDKAPARWSRGDGALCDACGEITTTNQVMMEAGPSANEKQQSLCFHDDCCQLWNAETQTKPR
jgi:hypothetical protein